MKVLLTHPGTQYSYQLARQLERQGVLYAFATGLAFSEPNLKLLKKFLPVFLQKKIEARTVMGVHSKKLVRFPGLELIALLKLRFTRDTENVFHQRNERFQKKIPKQLIDEADIIIGFDTSSWLLIDRCKALGKPFILDASIAHPLAKARAYNDLLQQYPIWQKELAEKAPEILALECYEMAASTHIVAASNFTKSTYVANGIDATKISINPYGTDLSFFRSKWIAALPGSTGSLPETTLRFFFLGSITARKGIPWLCTVWQQFHAAYPNTALIVAGYGAPPENFEWPKGVECIGALHPNDRYQWFQQADVFVFPSFFEGFAQVIIEAMATGLPVITTTATAGTDVISQGIDGWVIEPGDDAALLTALGFFAAQPKNIEKMGRLAREKVLDFTWDNYGQRWKQILEQVCQNT